MLLREGIARLLTEAGFDVVAQAGDADDLLRKALAHRPDVALVRRADAAAPRGRRSARRAGAAAAASRDRRPRPLAVLRGALRARADRRAPRGRRLPAQGARRRRRGVRRRGRARRRRRQRPRPRGGRRGCSGAVALGRSARQLEPSASATSSRRWPRASRTAASPRRSSSARPRSRSTSPASSASSSRHTDTEHRRVLAGRRTCAHRRTSGVTSPRVSRASRHGRCSVSGVPGLAHRDRCDGPWASVPVSKLCPSSAWRFAPRRPRWSRRRERRRR